MLRFQSLTKVLGNNFSYKIQRQNKNIFLSSNDGKHDSTLIVLHGLGDSADGYLDIFVDDQFPIKLCPPGMNVILLTAPLRKVESVMGEYQNYQINSWFGMRRIEWIQHMETRNAKEFFNTDELEEARFIVQNYIDIEAKKIGYNKVFLFGFSQGCALVLHIGLSFNQQIGGILANSGFMLPFTKPTPNGLKNKILIQHGSRDDVIKLNFALKTYSPLLNLPNVKTEIIQGMEHTIQLESFQLIQKFLNHQ